MSRKIARKSKTQQPRQPTLNERLIQESLTPFVEALTFPDEARRQAVVQHVLHTCVPGAIARLIDRLVDLLGSGDCLSRRQAIASLTQFGSLSLPALTSRFMPTQSVACQQGIVEALEGIARHLQPEHHFDLMTELMILPHFALNDSICLGLARVVAVLRRASEAHA